MLERLDPNPEYWEGKRGAAVGVFQMIIAGREDRSAGWGEKENADTKAVNCVSDKRLLMSFRF